MSGTAQTSEDTATDAARRLPGGGDDAGVAALDAAATRVRVPRVVLLKGKARLFWDGQPLVYGGAVADVSPPLPATTTGAPVLVADHTGRPLGWGVYNAHSMYRVRLLGTVQAAAQAPELCLDVDATVAARTRDAAALRARLGLPTAGVTTCYRLVNSEGDRLSGLVVDVFDTVIVVQCTAAWAHARRQMVAKALLDAVPMATTVLWRPQKELLEKEGLGEGDAITGDVVFNRDGAAGGEVPDQMVVLENGVHYNISLLSGQKTGFFLDQRDNRARVRALAAAGRANRVLDLCCYSGGFAINAALGGAKHVTGVDSSAPALALATSNAALNGVSATFVRGDVMEYVQAQAFSEEGRGQWDCVILDPPKLAPNKHALVKATARYRRLNALAAALVAPGGVLVTCTCSGAMAQSGAFPALVSSAVATSGRHAALLGTYGPAMCHVTSPAYPEGNYLEACFLAVQ